mmetsp:Transcript_5207/g.685  ORF Transcript_5207/g.685 Transcript_5207/m.685 type:complete len:97 (+) Transcript_5207:42-332(+)
MIDTYLSGKDAMWTGKRPDVFELLGFDFLIDEDFRVWLIEVNTNPYLGVPNDYIAGLLPKMVDDLFEIVIDPIFPPNSAINNSPNDFEVLYTSKNS